MPAQLNAPTGDSDEWESKACLADLFGDRYKHSFYVLLGRRWCIFLSSPLGAVTIESVFGAASGDNAFCEVADPGRLAVLRVCVECFSCLLVAGGASGNLFCPRFRSNDSAESTSAVGSESCPAGAKARTLAAESGTLGAVARAGHQKSRGPASA